MNLEIIYEDNCILVAYKPAGLATQTNRLGEQDMVTTLKNYRAKKGEKPYIGLIHRLDQPVEGVMVFAKTEKAAADLSKQVQTRSIGKYYFAVCAEAPDPRQGTLEDEMVFDKKRNTSYIVKDEKEKKEAAAKGLKVQKASLSYEVKAEACDQAEEGVSSASKLALVDVKLNTGRHHQIRLQFANAGHPLIGDLKYGKALPEIPCKNVALCSYRLDFVHPESKKEMTYSISPRGEIFHKYFEA